MARTTKARRRRRTRSVRIDIAIVCITGGTLSGITIADYIHRGRVNEVLAGALLTVSLTAVGRIADVRAQRDENDDDG